MRYLSPRLSYFYSQFVKTNICYIGILLPVQIQIQFIELVARRLKIKKLNKQ